MSYNNVTEFIKIYQENMFDWICRKRNDIKIENLSPYCLGLYKHLDSIGENLDKWAWYLDTTPKYHSYKNLQFTIYIRDISGRYTPGISLYDKEKDEIKLNESEVYFLEKKIYSKIRLYDLRLDKESNQRKREKLKRRNLLED